MKDYSKDRNINRDAIIGLGERSVRKSHYPELQETSSALEKVRSRNLTLMMAIPDILLVANKDLVIMPFASSSMDETKLTLKILRSEWIKEKISFYAKLVFESSKETSFEFCLEGDQRLYFEARLYPTSLMEVLIIIRDITDKVAKEEALRIFAERDYLTNLYNRRMFEERLLDYKAKDYENISLAILDIDGLKGINDTFGHREGDRVILHMSGIVQSHFVGAELMGRIGGNEFAVMYVNREAVFLESLCESFAESLKGENEYDKFPYTVSYGIGHTSRGGISIEDIHLQADSNMRRKKLLSDRSQKSGLVKTLMKALEAKDYITEGHTDRMTDLAQELGRAFKQSQEAIDRLSLLTIFHDLGKIGIPDSILKKEGPLTEEEWLVMKTHCRIGENIASASSELKSIASLILMHHEKWDGTGYPLKIRGEEIPIECRILTLVDAYDAMTNDRPYRKALTKEAALEEIRRCSGKQFDPEAVEVFIRYINLLDT